MIQLETERLSLRNFRPDDWRDLRELAVKYQASEYSKYDHKWPTDEKGVKGMADWFSQADRFHAVCIKDTGKLIGLISLNHKEEEQGEIYGFGYVFHPDYQGQGYASESCKAVIDHAFSSLDADRFSTGTAAANLPSCRLLERLGFEITDRRRGSFRQTPDGEAIEIETLSLGLTRERWIALQQGTLQDQGESHASS
jgi:RimJ/RimL family protein N-acetyltransferase